MTMTANNNHDVDIGPSNKGPDCNRMISENFANVLARAYLDACDEVREVINDMSRICSDDAVDETVRESALDTLTEALFPQTHKGELGVDLEDIKMTSRDGTDVAAIEEQKRAEQATFAIRLASFMETQNLNQVELAEKTGVGQSAISMMLNRACRPQRRTIKKLADAFGVQPIDLWPDYSD